MALDQTRRIRPDVIQSDRVALTAVQQLPDFQPVNSRYAMSALANAHAVMEAARNDEIKALNALNAARDAVTSAEWTFHNTILGAKQQVVAQYGADSDEVQALGLKKKSERKRPVRRTSPSK